MRRQTIGRAALQVSISLLLALAVSRDALAQLEETAATGQAAAPAGPAVVLKKEAGRYLQDGKSLLLAPVHWTGTNWLEAAAVTGAVAILATQDSSIDSGFQRNRSSSTDSVARAVTPFGAYAAVGVSVGSLGAGLLFKDERLRDIGRDAVEAEVFAAGIVTPVLKTAFGRTRPVSGGDGDEYRPLSNGQSFPSGHATEAFAVASVFAARSSGWVVPVVAYTLATGVGLARMNDRAHFASDVVAGAVIGTAIGRAIVHRHTGDGPHGASWNLVPVHAERGGVGIGLKVASGS